MTMTNQDKIDSILHLKGEKLASHGYIWEILEAPKDRDVFAKYLELRYKQGEGWAKSCYANYEMDVFVVFKLQQLMSPYQFDEFIEKIRPQLENS
jgi:hypothetical protein